jgi:hypothetical protein
MRPDVQPSGSTTRPGPCLAGSRPSPRVRGRGRIATAPAQAIRRVLVAFVALVLAAPVATAAASSPVQAAPAPPLVTVVGLAVQGADPGTVVLAADAPGIASVQLAPGSAPGALPVGYLVERPAGPAVLADVRPSSPALDQVATADPGTDWVLPLGRTTNSTVFLQWVAGARPVDLDVRAVGPDGTLSAPTDLHLETAASAVPPATLSARLHGGSIVIAWREAGTIATAARALGTATAPLVAGSCGTWHAASGVRLPDPAQPASPVPAASLVARTFEQDLPAPTALVDVTSVPVADAVMPSRLGRVAPTLATDGSGGHLSMAIQATGGTCYRFAVRLVDALGRVTARASSTVVVPLVAGRHEVAWPGSLDLYRPGAFATQANWKWCVAASTEMMVNLVRHRSGQSVAAQRAIILWAKAHDVGNYKKGGTDTVGWLRALAYFGAGPYRQVTAGSLSEALRIAATAIRTTGRPVGITVADGRHAWVLHGFSSAADPLVDPNARITAVRVSGPLWPRQTTNGYDLPPDTELTAAQLATYYTPWVTSKGQHTGRWVLVIPVR